MPHASQSHRRGGAVAVIIAVVVPAMAALQAQSLSGGAIVGQVTDQQGATLQSAVVTAVDRAGFMTRSVTTDAVGRFRIGGLEPGDYTISAVVTDFARLERPLVTVREGVTVTVLLSLTLGPISDVVVVRADTPMVDVTSPGQGINIGGDLQRMLPLTSLATWADFLLIVPGIATTQARLQTYFSQGTTHASGVFLVDGADATSVLQGSTLYSQFAAETFNDIHVKTGGIDAASPLGFGPVVNISTRSGTNQWRGTAVVEYQGRRWNDRNTPAGEDLTVVTRQQDFSIGGPLVRNRSWVFASGRIARNATGNPRSAEQLSFVRRVDPGFETFDNEWSGEFGYMKVSAQLTPKHAVVASFSHDVVTLGGAQPNESGAFRDVIAGGPGAFAGFSSTWAASLLTRVSVHSNGKKQRNENLQPGTTGVLVHQAAFSSAGRLIGSGPIAAINASPFPGTDFDVSMWTISADVTHARSDRSGSHSVQGGFYAQPHRRNRWITRYNNHGFQLEEVVLQVGPSGAPSFVPFHRQVFDTGELVTRHVDSRDFAGYVQDTWNVTPQLTITAGVRIDRIMRIDRIFDTETQRTTAIGPRAGLAFAPTRESKGVVRASWTRMHENLSVNDTVAGSAIAGVRDLYDTGFDGSFSTVIVSPPRTALSPDVVFDLDGYRQHHADEFVVGYQQQFAGLTTAGITLGRRVYRNRPALVETNAKYEQGAFVGYHDESRNGVYRLTSNVWNWPIVTTLQATVTRETPRLQLIAGFTRSSSRLGGTWQPGDPASFIQPDAFPNRDGVGFITGCTSGGPFCPDSDSLSTGFGGGTWREHLFNSGAVYRSPWGVQLGLAYTAQSGPWSGPIQTRVDAPDPRFGPPTITLSNGRVVANPLATTIRFAYPTRGEGQFRLGAMHLLNARVAFGVPVGRRRFDFAINVFNVANAGADQALQPGAHQVFSPFFGQGSIRQFPRAGKVSMRFAF
jgi:hypothetical protein